jgi:mono/diheme cytochrome c family protein
MFRFSPTTTTGAPEVARQTFPITVPRRGLLRSPGRAFGCAVAAILLWVRALDAGAFEPSVNYMLHCMGCHTPDGRGEPGHVPSVRDTLVPFASTAEGRQFLVQVPGAAQSTLSDAELAEVLNWMVGNLSSSPTPPVFRKFTAAEVAGYRGTPLVAVSAVRERLLSDSKRSAARR